MLKNFLKTTFRNIRQNKTYSFLNFFGLAIGIACAGTIFLWVENEKSFDHSYVNRDRLYQVMTNQTYEGVIRTFASTPGRLADAMVKELPGISNACRTSGGGRQSLFTNGNKSIFEQGMYADSSFFPMFRLDFVDGNPGHAFVKLQCLVISQKMAKQFFGTDHGVVGRTIRVDNKDEYEITGVFRDLPQTSTMQYEWIAPFGIYASTRDWLKYWGAFGPRTYALLEASAHIGSVEKRLSGFLHEKDKSVNTQAILFAMNDWHLRGNFVGGKQTGGRIEFVQLFAVIAWIILVIACINFMNLATARSERRSREVGVRKVLGAGRASLLLQFIGEAMTMSFISVGIGLVFIVLILPYFNTLVGTNIHLGLNNPKHASAVIVIAVFCGLVAGSYPSLYLSSFNPIYAFKGVRIKNGSASLVRKSLVVFQFSVSVILIICTVLVYQQVQHIKNRDLGYEKEGLLDMKVNGSLQTDFSAIKQDLINTGLVENAALCSSESLFTSNNSSGYSWQGKDPNSNIIISYRAISPEYISTMKMRLLDGRDFRPHFQSDSMHVIVTESLQKLMGNGSAVGKIIQGNNKSFTVIGVIKDYIYGDMYGKPDPVIFFANPGEGEYFYIRYKPRVNTTEALAKTAAILKKDNPAYPFEYDFVDDQFDGLFKTETLVANLSRIFAGLAIVISCLGLFGLSAFMAEQRTKEIGIRKVLGANVAGIVSLLSFDFLKIVGISIVIASPVAYFMMDEWLQDFAYRIQIGWWVFAMAGFAAIVIALITVSFQAIRAAVLNPVTTLRAE
jgi:putative ABC transport system permease protein